MKHIELEITANEYQQEELIALLDDFHPSGFEQTDDLLKAYFEEENFSKEDILPVLDGYDYKVKEIENRNWNAVWEENFQPVTVDDFCAVRAHFHPPITSVQHEIIITPKMSFGTGHHATTYMMLKQMKNIDFLGKTVFDFGTGTGILAILAEKLGALSVNSIDVDDWSIENAAENFERNNCTKITVAHTSNLPQQTFDVVLANINRNVILAYLSQLVHIVVPGGLILFSGLLTSDKHDIVDEAGKHGLKLIRDDERSNWISLLFKMP